MMTPLELEKLEFEKAMGRKYKKASVDDAFDVIRRDFETLYRENIEYRDKVTMLESLIAKYKAMEDSMQSALLLAQQTGEECIKLAREKADSLIRAAEEKAEAVVAQAETELAKTSENNLRAKKELSVFAVQNISLLEAQVEILNNLKKNCEKDF